MRCPAVSRTLAVRGLQVAALVVTIGLVAYTKIQPNLDFSLAQPKQARLGRERLLKFRNAIKSKKHPEASETTAEITTSSIVSAPTTAATAAPPFAFDTSSGLVDKFRMFKSHMYYQKVRYNSWAFCVLLSISSFGFEVSDS